MRRSRYDYYTCFREMTQISYTAAQMLDDLMREHNEEELPYLLDQLHKIENKGDDLMHEAMDALQGHGSAPFEREDVVALIQAFDDVTDTIEDVAMGLYMYCVQEIPKAALDFVSLILEGAILMRDVALEFSQFKKSTVLKDKVIAVNAVEEKGDALYRETMHHLYATEENLVKILRWTQLFDKLEASLDAMEQLANLVDVIAVKYR